MVDSELRFLPYLEKWGRSNGSRNGEKENPIGGLRQRDNEV